MGDAVSRVSAAIAGIDAAVREQMETVIAELRRRVGGTFTLSRAGGDVRRLGAVDPDGHLRALLPPRLDADGLVRRRRGVPPVRAGSARLPAVTVTSQRPRRQRRRRPVLRALLVAATLGVVFALGVALGQSIATDQTPEGATTQTRTIVPVAATRQTVTVTTTVTTP